MHEFRMPMLGADMEAGTLVEWVKHPGDPVKRGDIIAVVDTQKGAIEIEVFEDGIIDRILVPVGRQVPVGTVLAMLRGEGEAATPALPPVPAPAAGAYVRAVPAARKRAAELGVDLAGVVGTGPDGAVMREDVERAATAHPASAAPTPAAAPSAPAADARPAMRAAIAAAMARAKREIPHYYLSTTIDLDAALSWLRTQNAATAVTARMLPVVLLVKAVALALGEVPELNGHWVDGAFRPGSGIHVGCAIALRGGGLVAPALHDADRQDLRTLMRRILDVTARARAGSLRSSELGDPTITVTNLGDQGVDAGFGVIYPPQVAIVGFGRVAERPWVVGGAVVARSVVTATLSGDHRASDGHRGGLFLAAIDRLLQRPEAL
jgi:pyruvate dehydrogenase E2 component (dihydrolipoamide acetyltransferase)